MARMIIQFEIDTTEHEEDLLERARQALEVARYDVCNGSAGPKEDHDSLTRMHRALLRKRIAETVAGQGEGASPSELYDIVMDVPLDA